MLLCQARKALSALRGLVKLQALVRGHQVRKQTNATLQRMHALISIQVRARVQRIQMAEEAHLHVKKQPSIHRNFTLDNELRRIRRVNLILFAFYPTRNILFIYIRVLQLCIMYTRVSFISFSFRLLSFLTNQTSVKVLERSLPAATYLNAMI